MRVLSFILILFSFTNFAGSLYCRDSPTIFLLGPALLLLIGPRLMISGSVELVCLLAEGEKPC